MKQMSFVAAINDYFGRLPGQNLTEFQKEIKDLTTDDRQYFIRELATVGYQVTPLVQ